MHNKSKKYACAALLLYWVLGAWKGYVAIFEKGQEEPRQIFPYSVASLPPADQEALEQGITVRTEQQLQQLLEDYLS